MGTSGNHQQSIDVASRHVGIVAGRDEGGLGVVKKLGIGCGTLVALFFVLGIIGAMTGAGTDTRPSASPSPSPSPRVAPSPSPSPLPSPAADTSPSPSPSVAPSAAPAETPAPSASGRDTVAIANRVKEILRENYSDQGPNTVGYQDVKDVEVIGSLLVVKTDFYPDDEGKLAAAGVCRMSSFAVYNPEHTDLGLDSIRVMGQAEYTLASRHARNEPCQTR